MSLPSPTPGQAQRIALFCAEALRPAACCVVDALEIRGYTTQLWTGRNAAAALARSRKRTDADLRVLLAPEAIDDDVHRKLLKRLDPHRSGDVLLLAFERPCDAVAAVERATGRVPPRAIRTRPSRPILAHPTLIESKLELRRWVRPVAAGTATFAALTAALVLSNPATSQGVRGAPAVSAVAAPAVVRISDGPTLAAIHSATIPVLDPEMDLASGSDASFEAEIDDAFDASFDASVDGSLDDELERYGDEIIIFDDDVVAARPRDRAQDDAATDALYDAIEAGPGHDDVGPAAPPAAAGASATPPVASAADITAPHAAWGSVAERLDEPATAPQVARTALPQTLPTRPITLADPFAM